MSTRRPSVLSAHSAIADTDSFLDVKTKGRETLAQAIDVNMQTLRVTKVLTSFIRKVNSINRTCLFRQERRHTHEDDQRQPEDHLRFAV